MGLIDFVRSKIWGTDGRVDITTCVSEMEDTISYKILTMEASIRLISKTLARGEFQTFNKGKELRSENYYTLNIQPNVNHSAYNFWTKVIRTLLLEGEALVVMRKEELFLADSFEKEEFALKEDRYKDITISGYLLPGIKKESEVIYLCDDNQKITQAVNSIYEDYATLIKSSNKGYSNSKSRKGTLKIPMSYAKTFEEGDGLQTHIQKLMKDFMDPTKDAVFPETNGLEYTEVAEAKGSKSNDSGRETKNFIDDVFDFVGVAFGIPPTLLKGDTVDTKDAVNNFLAFCINPLAELIEDEINRKMYKKKKYLENTYCKLNTGSIKAVDLRDIANSLELLTRTGSNTIDDNLRALGREPVGGDVGGSRFVTKNLGTVENVMNEERNSSKGDK